MRILEFKAENIKRLIKVEIRPDQSLVQITGANGQGKTSVMDAIWWAMAGTRVIQTHPIRDGADRAVIRLDLGEVVVTRTFNRHDDKTPPYTTDLKVERADGSRFTKAQEVLTSFVGALTFDPLAFLTARPAEQFDIVRGFVSGVDFAEIARADEKDREARRIASQRAEELGAQAKAITLPPGKLPRRVDVAALEAKIGEAATHNIEVERRRARRETVQRDIDVAQEQIAGHQRRIEADRKALAEAPPLPEPTDVSQVQADLAAARASNATLDAAARKADLEAQEAAKDAEAVALTEKIKKREADKQAAIAASAMPVEGLGFEGTALTFNGQPFDQVSDAEQLKVSFAIAGALNPELRVIRIRDGSRLDSKAMKWMAAYAEEHDLQVWIERVDESGEVGFVMEAGRLKGDEAEDDLGGEAV